MTCILADRPCPLSLLGWLVGGVFLEGPKFGVSLPKDMIERDLPCPVAGLTLLICAAEEELVVRPWGGLGTTLKESVDLWPLA